MTPTPEPTVADLINETREWLDEVRRELGIRAENPEDVLKAIQRLAAAMTKLGSSSDSSISYAIYELRNALNGYPGE